METTTTRTNIYFASASIASTSMSTVATENTPFCLKNRQALSTRGHCIIVSPKYTKLWTSNSHKKLGVLDLPVCQRPLQLVHVNSVTILQFVNLFTVLDLDSARLSSFIYATELWLQTIAATKFAHWCLHVLRFLSWNRKLYYLRVMSLCLVGEMETMEMETMKWRIYLKPWLLIGKLIIQWPVYIYKLGSHEERQPRLAVRFTLSWKGTEASLECTMILGLESTVQRIMCYINSYNLGVTKLKQSVEHSTL